MTQYTYEIHSSRKNHDLVVDRYENFYDAEGNWRAESLPHTATIHPGDDVADQPKRVRRAAAAEHPPTVVDKYKAEQEYETAMEALAKEDTTKTRKAVTAAKTKLDAARKAYDDFESS